MSQISGILMGIFALCVLIFVHELGHFLVAKMCGVNVLEFSIGFGKKICAWKRGLTRYSIGLIPLGGYVRMMGDDPRYFDKENEGKSLEEIEASLSKTTGDFIGLEDVEKRSAEEVEVLNDRSRWFLSKNYWQKSAIVFAGPFFNIAFAWLTALFLVSFYGTQDFTDEPVIGSIRQESPAEKAGFKLGDRVITLEGKKVVSWKAFSNTIRKSHGGELEVVVEDEAREQRTLKVTPEKINEEMAIVYGDDPKALVIGVGPKLQDRAASSIEAIIIASNYTYNVSALTIKSLWAMLSGLISPKHIGGPISIVNVASKSAQGGLESLLAFMIMISITLAIMNLLPIPVLDGGHLLFFTIEALIGTRLSLKFYERTSMVGMAAILSLMVFAFGNDLFNIFFK